MGWKKLYSNGKKHSNKPVNEATSIDINVHNITKRNMSFTLLPTGWSLIKSNTDSDAQFLVICFLMYRLKWKQTYNNTFYLWFEWWHLWMNTCIQSPQCSTFQNYGNIYCRQHNLLSLLNYISTLKRRLYEDFILMATELMKN